VSLAHNNISGPLPAWLAALPLSDLVRTLLYTALSAARAPDGLSAETCIALAGSNNRHCVCCLQDLSFNALSGELPSLAVPGANVLTRLVLRGNNL
jgi:hypothetical protein